MLYLINKLNKGAIGFDWMLYLLWLRAEVVRWPRKTLTKGLTANNNYSLAA